MREGRYYVLALLFFPTLDERKVGDRDEREEKPNSASYERGWLSSRGSGPRPHVRILGPPHAGQRFWASVGSDLPESPCLTVHTSL